MDLETRIKEFRTRLESYLLLPNYFVDDPKIVSEFDNLIKVINEKNKLINLTNYSAGYFDNAFVFEMFDLVRGISKTSNSDKCMVYLSSLGNAFKDKEYVIKMARSVLFCNPNDDLDNLQRIVNFVNDDYVNKLNMNEDRSDVLDLMENLSYVIEKMQGEDYFSSGVKLLYTQSTRINNLNRICAMFKDYQENLGEVITILNEVPDYNLFRIVLKRSLVKRYIQYENRTKIETKAFIRYHDLFYNTLIKDDLFYDLKGNEVNNLLRAYDLSLSAVSHNCNPPNVWNDFTGLLFKSFMRESYSDYEINEDKIKALNEWSVNVSDIIKKSPEIFFEYITNHYLAVGGDL